MNSRFATLFKEQRESLSPYPSPTFTRRVPTFARRAPTILPAGKHRQSLRALPQPPHRKLLKNRKQESSRSKPRPSKPSPFKAGWRSTRTVHLGGPRQKLVGPRGWKSKRPSALPKAPLRNTRPFPMHTVRQHIFVTVPNLDFSLQRESFGIHSTVREKLHLLSQPRSRTSAQTLAPKTHRCYMMQQVRREMAKAQARRDKQESSSEPPRLPLHPRPQWMRDEQPFVSEDEADRHWQEGT